ncbi:LITAF-like zinc ribbon domain-containing protein [Chlamydoabsidia padenii]|nr:LITAF-like zinc ribbon domain-containing protein [Chlamydoabsidia padenii]
MSFAKIKPKDSIDKRSITESHHDEQSIISITLPTSSSVHSDKSKDRFHHSSLSCSSFPSSLDEIHANSLIRSDRVHRYSFETPSPPLFSNSGVRSSSSSAHHSSSSFSTTRKSSSRHQTSSSILFLGRSLPDFQTLVYCSVCEKWIESRLRYRNGAMVWLAAFVLLLCTIVFFWVPFYSKMCKDVHHFCPTCGREIGRRQAAL